MNAVTAQFKKLEKVPGFGNRYVRYVVVPFVLLAVVTLTVVLLLWLSPRLPVMVWQVLGITMLALIILWWFTRGILWFEQYRFLNRQRGDLTPDSVQNGTAGENAMRASLIAAKNIIARSPKLDRGRDPIYRIPWLLMLGDAAAGQKNLLAIASATSPYLAPEKMGSQENQYWHWWFYKQMIAIETDTSFPCDPGVRAVRGVWYTALQLLKSNRPKLPLNGMVLLVSAQTLAGSAEALRVYCLRLRRLVDEAMEHLELDVPVYIVVTGLDDLPGFPAFLNALPQEVATQALGHRLENDKPIGAVRWQEIEATFESLWEALWLRLHGIRLTALKRETDTIKRKGIFDFVTVFGELRPGLFTMVQLLLEDNPFQRTPQLRGLYFAGTQHHPAFVHDLFTRFLPADQPLAKRTHQPRFRRWLRALVGMAGVAGLSFYLTWSVVTAYREDRNLLAKALLACPIAEAEATTRTLIHAMNECRKKVDEIETEAFTRGLSFGINKHKDAIEKHKQRVIEAFSRYVLGPYDENLHDGLVQGLAGFDHYLMLSQRLTLVRQCLRDRWACLMPTGDANFIFDPVSRLYRPVDTLDEQELGRQATTGRELFDTYRAYLRWQNNAALKAEQEKLVEYLNQLIRGHPLTLADVAAWSRVRYKPVTVERFWRPPRSSLTDSLAKRDDAARSFQIDSAYTRQVWENVLLPFLTRFRDFPIDNAQFIKQFTSGYFEEYFRQWRIFLSRFHEGFELWKGQSSNLIDTFVYKDSPYTLLWESVRIELLSLPLDIKFGARFSESASAIKNDWAGIFSYIGDLFSAWWKSSDADYEVPPPVWLMAVAHTLEVEWKQAAPLVIKIIGAVQSDTTAQNSYALATEIFQGKSESDTSLAPAFTKLMQLVNRPAGKYDAEMKPGDQAAWSVVQGPVKMLLALILYRASQFVQLQWQQTVLEPVKNLPPNEQLTALFGENGKFYAFQNDWLKPFIAERSKLPVKFFGVALPLSASYEQMLNQGSKMTPLTHSDKAFDAGTVQFTKPSNFGSMEEGAQGSIFEMDCHGNRFTAASRGASLADSRTNIFWSPANCQLVRIKISLPDLPAANIADSSSPPLPSAPFALVKTYTGSDGFLALINDFKTGAKVFTGNDFMSSYSSPQWQEAKERMRQLDVNKVTVFLEVKLSPEMELYRSAPSELSVPISLVE